MWKKLILLVVLIGLLSGCTDSPSTSVIVNNAIEVDTNSIAESLIFQTINGVLPWTDANVSDILTLSADSNVNWLALDSYPSACATGYAVQGVGDTLTCVELASAGGTVTWSALGDILPLGDVNVANDITLTNLTQITNRSYTVLQDKPSLVTNLSGDGVSCDGSDNNGSCTITQTGGGITWTQIGEIMPLGDANISSASTWNAKLDWADISSLFPIPDANILGLDWVKIFNKPSIVTNLTNGLNTTSVCDGTDQNGSCQVNVDLNGLPGGSGAFYYAGANLTLSDENYFNVNDANLISANSLLASGDNVSELTNDAGYITGYVDSSCDNNADCTILYSTIQDINGNTTNLINALDLNNSLSYLKSVDLNGYMTQSTFDSNILATNLSLLVQDSDFNASFNRTADTNNTARIEYTAIANAPWITSAGADTNAQTACGDGNVLDGDGSCYPYISVNTGDWNGTLDGFEATDLLDRANHIGTQLAATISDFSDTVLALFSGTGPITFTGGVIGFEWNADYNAVFDLRWNSLFGGRQAFDSNSSYDDRYVNESDLNNGTVSQIVAGTNITLDPSDGIGVVTINSTASGGTGGFYYAGANLTLSDENYFNVNDANLISANSLLASGDNVSELTNDAGYITESSMTDTTLDTNATAETSWLGKEHTFTANQQFDLNISSGTTGNVTIIGDENKLIGGATPGLQWCIYTVDQNVIFGWC